MGQVEPTFVEAFRTLECNHPHQVRYLSAFDMEIAFLIYAGSDFTIMPSYTEPCGLNQQIAQAFGTISPCAPVGGLVDTIVSHLSNPDKSDGFLIDFSDIKQALKQVNSVLDWYTTNKTEVYELISRAMRKDNSWLNTASKFSSYYQSIRKGTENVE
jgi:starch synthase